MYSAETFVCRKGVDLTLIIPVGGGRDEWVWHGCGPAHKLRRAKEVSYLMALKEQICVVRSEVG